MRLLRYIAVAVVLFLAVQSESVAAAVDFRDLVKAAGPAVVNINTEKTVQRRGGMPYGFDMFQGQPDIERFWEFFDGGSRRSPQQGTTQKRHSLGSGFVISADGYIVTNNHVVAEADVIKVSFSNNDSQKNDDAYTAKIVGSDPDTDLALLKIEATNLAFLAFGDSEALEVGEWVLAIGNPLGLDRTVTAGIISAKSRNIHSGSYDDFLQTDASINPGNSGGPLLSMDGKVVGINTAIARQAQGIGFAIPSNMANKIINDLRVDKRVSRGWLGVTIQNIDAAAAKALGLANTSGVLINSALEGEPAAKAGIQAGDVILAVNGETITDTDHLLRKVAMLPPGREATLTMWKDAKRQDLKVLIMERSDKGSGQEAQNALETELGLTVRKLEAAEMEQLRHSGQTALIVVNVKPQGVAAKVDIRQNDIIISVNRKPVSDVSTLNNAVAEARKKNAALLLQLSRKGQLFFKGIEFGK